MNTSEQAVSIGRRRRRRHSAAFRAEAVAACQQPGVSVAAVALARGLNANLLRRWVLQAERGALLVPTPSTAPAVESTAGFVPVRISSTATSAAIRIEVRRGRNTVSVEWPASAARECALLLRELMK